MNSEENKNHPSLRTPPFLYRHIKSSSALVGHCLLLGHSQHSHAYAILQCMYAIAIPAGPSNADESGIV